MYFIRLFILDLLLSLQYTPNVNVFYCSRYDFRTGILTDFHSPSVSVDLLSPVPWLSGDVTSHNISTNNIYNFNGLLHRLCKSFRDSYLVSIL